MQTFTFYASDDKLENRGQTLTISVSIQPLCRILKVFFLLQTQGASLIPSGRTNQRGRLRSREGGRQ